MTWPPLCDDCGWQHLNSCDDAPEPTPIERALGILAPHLDGVPLYRDR